jgi:hypothetical protein
MSATPAALMAVLKTKYLYGSPGFCRFLGSLGQPATDDSSRCPNGPQL